MTDVLMSSPHIELLTKLRGVPTRRRVTPVQAPDRYNPLDPKEIGRSLREKLEQQEALTFPPEKFAGAGLYAIYWAGDHPLYARLRGTFVPLYVGKAEAGNSSYGFEPDYTRDKLWRRIEKHSKSVSEVSRTDEADTLNLTDFRVRFLCLEDAWIVLGERALLAEYRPVLWNTIMNGFGSNPPGTARRNARSVWDTVHPGRERAGYLPNRGLTLEEMLARIARGIDISLMPSGPEKETAISQLQAERPPVIWAPAKSRDSDKRMRVADPERFNREVERMGITVEPVDYRVVGADEVEDEAEAALDDGLEAASED